MATFLFVFLTTNDCKKCCFSGINALTENSATDDKEKHNFLTGNSQRTTFRAEEPRNYFSQLHFRDRTRFNIADNIKEMYNVGLITVLEDKTINTFSECC